MTNRYEDQGSQDDETESVRILKSIFGLLKIFTGTMIPIVAIVLWTLIADHFDLQTITQDDQWMKPRVNIMWYKTHADVSESIDSQGIGKHTEQ